jgi:hypothetical protein
MLYMLRSFIRGVDILLQVWHYDFSKFMSGQIEPQIQVSNWLTI